MKPPVLLRIFVNEKLEGVKQFADEQIVFGRNSDLQVELDNNDVSPLHALIEERDSGYYLSDLGSTSGTFVNDERVLDAKLESGDEIKIGPYKIQFFVGVPKPTAPPQEMKKAEASVTFPANPEEVKVDADESDKAPQLPSDDTQAPEPPDAIVSSGKTVPSDTPSLESKRVDESKSGFSGPGPVPVPDDSATQDVEPLEIDETTDVTEIQPGLDERTQKIVPLSRRGTFAPESKHKDPEEFLKPGKGTTVEVVVSWQERILSSHHFSKQGLVYIGTDPQSDVVVPLLGTSLRKHGLVDIDAIARVRVTQEMSGELIQPGGRTSFSDLVQQGRLGQGPNGYEIQLNQGEMVKIVLAGGLVTIYVRYVEETPKPLAAPFLDLTASEITGVILAVAVAAIFGLYMMIYSPSQLDDEDLLEEPIRKATVTFKPPRPIAKKVEIVKEKSEPKKKVVKVVDLKKVTKKAPQTTAPKKKPGKAAEVKPNKVKTKKKVYTSARSGGAIKTGKKGASTKSQKKDPSKVGILGVFGTRGTQKKLDKVYSGAGELQGIADSATGFAGQRDSRPGDNIGTKLKTRGAGGIGTATVGIAGVGTKGRGTGTFGYGAGGIGKKGKVEINVGGQEATFEGSINREAIRRVILQNKRAIRSCYERALNRNPDLHGKIVLQWDIEEEGRVSRTSTVTNTMGSKQVANCIRTRLKTWRFPEPPADQTARVRYPFVFSSQ